MNLNKAQISIVATLVAAILFLVYFLARIPVDIKTVAGALPSEESFPASTVVSAGLTKELTGNWHSEVNDFEDVALELYASGRFFMRSQFVGRTNVFTSAGFWKVVIRDDGSRLQLSFDSALTVPSDAPTLDLYLQAGQEFVSNKEVLLALDRDASDKLILKWDGVLIEKQYGLPTDLGAVTQKVVWEKVGDSIVIADLQGCPGTDKEQQCILAVMDEQGASKEAQLFYQRTGWFASDFAELGTVDLLTVVNPWRANSNEDYVFVNGAKSLLVEELADAFNSYALENRDLMAAQLRGHTIWPSDEVFVRKTGESFIFEFDIKDEKGCHACSSGYSAYVSFAFNQLGAYEGARLESICRDSGKDDERFDVCGE